MVKIEPIPILQDHLTGIILSPGKARFEERCCASVEKRNAARRQKNPADRGPWELIGCVPLLARCSGIARRSAPSRMNSHGPSNWSYKIGMGSGTRQARAGV